MHPAKVSDRLRFSYDAPTGLVLVDEPGHQHFAKCVHLPVQLLCN